MNRQQRRAQGTARGLIAWVLMVIGWTWFLWDLVQLNVGGLMVAGVVLIIVALYLMDVFTKAFWARDQWAATITEDHPDALGSLDLIERAHRQEQDR